MYKPQTDDLLPRPPPKPSLPLDEVPIIKPVVPEVSILFGQEPVVSNGVMSSEKIAVTGIPKSGLQKTTSYATWKKQILPKVAYSMTNDGNQPISKEHVPIRSNLYPMRVGAITTTSVAPPISTVDTWQYRQSLDSIQTASSPQPPPPTMPIETALASKSPIYQPYMQRRSFDTLSTASSRTCNSQFARSVSNDVLTICAGTQTDAIVDVQINVENYATKQDIEAIYMAIQDLREMQIRLLQISETYILQSSQADKINTNKIPVEHTGVQCDMLDSKEINKEITLGVKPVNELKFVHQEQRKDQQHLIHTPQPTKPQAQSTTYRPNTPAQVRAPLTKAVTDKSMVMNELALKYLPNEKLRELLQELNISPKPLLQNVGTKLPLHEKENLDKGPNDLSTASYKYLKKYRLLPEEPNDSPQRLQAIDDNIQQSKSPLINRNGQSPACLPRIPEQILDLEHLRNQPKFL